MASRLVLVLQVLRTRATNLWRNTVQTILHILTCGHMGPDTWSQPEPKSQEITDRFGNTYSFDPKTTDDQISDRYYIRQTDAKSYYISQPV